MEMGVLEHSRQGLPYVFQEIPKDYGALIRLARTRVDYQGNPMEDDDDVGSPFTKYQAVLKEFAPLYDVPR